MGRLLIDAVTVFVVTLVVSVLGTLLWNLVVHGAGTVDRETSFRLPHPVRRDPAVDGGTTRQGTMTWPSP